MKYIDLGLPSGTLWADNNEKGLFTHEQAISIYNDRIPFEWHWYELKRYCACIPNPGGLIVISRVNNKSLFFPHTGYGEIGTDIIIRLDVGYYWLNDIMLLNQAKFVYLDLKSPLSGNVSICDNIYKHAVRLIRSSFDPLSIIF